MSRELAATTLAALDDPAIQKVVLVRFNFDDPVYAHSGLGDITWDGDTYVGIGMLGKISEHEESETLNAAPITFSLSGIDQMQLRSALDAITYGDEVDVWKAIVDDAGDLIGDPVHIYGGSVDSSNVVVGLEPVLNIIAQHAISDTVKKNGAHWTNEDHQRRYPGDEFFEYIHEVPTLRLNWGGSPTTTGVRAGPGPGLDYEDQQDHQGQG